MTGINYNFRSVALAKGAICAKECLAAAKQNKETWKGISRKVETFSTIGRCLLQGDEETDVTNKSGRYGGTYLKLVGVLPYCLKV